MEEKEAEMMLERLLSVEVTEHGTHLLDEGLAAPLPGGAHGGWVLPLCGGVLDTG